jgi:RHS repeat-associated protein
LTSVTDPVSSISSQFVYDASGNRVKEKVNNTPTKEYVNDVSSDLAYTLEAKDLTNSTSTYYIYGLGLLSQGDDSFSDRKYLLEDGIGNIRYVADTGGGEIEAYEYDPDGNEFLGGNTSDFRYKGEQLDPATGLYFMRARYYDPFTGNFVSHDPLEGDIMLPQSFNGYNYANNDPVNFADPSGKQVVQVIRACAPIAGKIVGYTAHGLEQAMERDGGRGVNPGAMLNAVKNPVQIVEQAEGAVKFIGDKATVVLNVAGEIITTWGQPRNPL